MEPKNANNKKQMPTDSGATSAQEARRMRCLFVCLESLPVDSTEFIFGKHVSVQKFQLAIGMDTTNDLFFLNFALAWVERHFVENLMTNDCAPATFNFIVLSDRSNSIWLKSTTV